MYKPVTNMRRGFILLLMVLIAGGTMAQLNPAEKLPLDPKVKIGKLDNGLTYYIRQNKKPEQKVELRLVLNAGSINEDENQRGLAHMAEHMAFNGTKNFRKNDIVSFLQSIGVGFGSDLNAETSFDQTIYMLPIPTDKPGNLEKGFQILEDWAHNVTYLTDDINGERNIIIEESRQGKNANQRMFKKILPQLFAGSKYAVRLPIGLDSLILHFNPDLIRKYYKDWYRPNLMAVVVVGDLDPAKAEAMIKKHFTRLKNPANPRKREEAEVPAYTKDIAEVITDKEATNFSVSVNYSAFKVAAASTVGEYRNNMVREFFMSMLNQRLGELTQKENPPFLGAQVGLGSYARGYSAFGAYAAAGTGDVNKALEALIEEIERAKRYGFTEAELERLKKSAMSSYENAYNNREKTESAGYVGLYANHFLEQQAIPGMEKEWEFAKAIVPTITVAEVNTVAELLKKEKNKYVYVMGPEGKGPLPDANNLLAIIDAKEKATVKPYEEKAIASTLLKSEPVAGKIVSTKKDTLMGATEITLSNGVTVSLKSTDFKDDQILFAAARPGGRNGYGVEDKFNTQWITNVIASMGMGEFSPTDLGKALAGKNVGVSLAFGGISSGINATSTVKDLETMFQLIHLQVTSPRKDVQLFQSFVQRNKSQFANISANPQAAFYDTLNPVVYEKNPLAPLAVPHSEFFDRINLDRVLEIYKEQFGDVAGMHIAITGSFKEADVLPLLEKYIASLPATTKRTWVDNKVRMVSGKHFFQANKGKEEKALILAFYNGEIPFDKNLPLKAAALSEVLNIRIIEELREKVQGIYGGGTSASVERIPYSAYSFVLQLPCGPEKVDTLLKAVKKEFADIIAKGPDAAHLDKVKKTWIEQYKVSLKDNGTWLNHLLNAKLRGESPEGFINYEKYLNKLTAKDVQDAAKLILGGPNQFIAVQMPDGAAMIKN